MFGKMLAKPALVKVLILFMAYSQDYGIVFPMRFPDHFEVVLFLYLVMVGSRIDNIDLDTKIGKFLDNIHYLRVTAIGNILLKRNPHNKCFCLKRVFASSDQLFHGLLSYIATHTIIHKTS